MAADEEVAGVLDDFAERLAGNAEEPGERIAGRRFGDGDRGGRFSGRRGLAFGDPARLDDLRRPAARLAHADRRPHVGAQVGQELAGPAERHRRQQSQRGRETGDPEGGRPPLPPQQEGAGQGQRDRGEHRLVVRGQRQQHAGESRQPPGAPAVLEAPVEGAEDAEHVEHLRLEPEHVARAGREQQQAAGEGGGDRGRSPPRQEHRGQPKHGDEERHVEEQQPVRAPQGGEGRSEQRVGQRLAVVDGLPSVRGHQDQVAGRSERELLQQPVAVRRLVAQVEVAGEAERHQVVGGLVRLERRRLTGFADRQRHRQQEEAQGRQRHDRRAAREQSFAVLEPGLEARGQCPDRAPHGRTPAGRPGWARQPDVPGQSARRRPDAESRSRTGVADAAVAASKRSVDAGPAAVQVRLAPSR